jgi:hypothetical protein
MNPSFARNPGLSHRGNPSITVTGGLATLNTDRSTKKKITPTSTPFPNLLKKIRTKLQTRYNTNLFTYDKKVVTEIIYNEKSHVVAKFKDFLILDDLSEFLRRFYALEESRTRIPKVTDYYENYSKIFPNYINLPEAKYIYKNIQRKQKLIDSQQRNANNENKQTMTKSKFIVEDKIFNTDVYDSIMNQTETVLFEDEKTVNSNISLEKLIGNIDSAEKKNENLKNGITGNTTTNTRFNTYTHYNTQAFYKPDNKNLSNSKSKSKKNSEINGENATVTSIVTNSNSNNITNINNTNVKKNKNDTNSNSNTFKIFESLNSLNTLNTININTNTLNNINFTTARAVVGSGGDKVNSVGKVNSTSASASVSGNKNKNVSNLVNAVNSNTANSASKNNFMSVNNHNINNTNTKHNLVSSTISPPVSHRALNNHNNKETTTTGTNKLPIEKEIKTYKIKSLSPPKKTLTIPATSSSISNNYTDRNNKESVNSLTATSTGMHKLETKKLQTIDTILNARTELKHEVFSNPTGNGVMKSIENNFNSLNKLNANINANNHANNANNLLTSSHCQQDEKTQFENKIFNKHKNNIEFSMKNKNKLSTDFSNMTALKEKMKDTFERRQSISKLMTSQQDNSGVLNALVPGNINFITGPSAFNSNIVKNTHTGGNSIASHRQTKSTVPKMTNNIFYIINQNPQVNNQITIFNNNPVSNSDKDTINKDTITHKETVSISPNAVISPHEKKLNTLRESANISAASIFKMKKSTLGINFSKNNEKVIASSIFNKSRGTSGASTSRKIGTSKIGKINVEGNNTNRDITPLNSSRQVKKI